MHRSHLKQFPLFIWLLLLVSSVSNFCPDTGRWRWSLVSVRLFSRAVGREGHCRQIPLACVGSIRSVPATLGLPPLVLCVLSPSPLLRLPAALQGLGPALRAVPVFRYSTKAQNQLGLPLVSSPARAAQAARSLMSALSPGAVCLIPSPVPASVSTCTGLVSLVSVLGSWSLAAVNHPESQEVFG